MPGETSPARGIRINIRQSVSRFCELQRHLGSELWAPLLDDHPAVSRAQYHGDPYMEGRRIVCRCRDCWLCPNCSYRHAGWFVNDLEDDDDFSWSVWVIHRIRQAELVYLRHVVLSGFLRTDVGYGTFTLVLTGRKVLWQLRQGHVRFAEATGNGHQAALYAGSPVIALGVMVRVSTRRLELRILVPSPLQNLNHFWGGIQEVLWLQGRYQGHRGRGAH